MTLHGNFRRNETEKDIAGERFADTVKRLGFEYVNEILIG